MHTFAVWAYVKPADRYDSQAAIDQSVSVMIVTITVMTVRSATRPAVIDDQLKPVETLRLLSKQSETKHADKEGK